MIFRGVRIATLLFDDPVPLTLDDVKKMQIAKLKSDCDASIQTAFASSALGSVHIYDAEKQRDRENLLGGLAKAALLSQPVLFTCTDLQTGLKARRLHTPEQFQQVFLDGTLWVEQNVERFYQLAAQVAAAQSAEEVIAVVWTDSLTRFRS